MANFYRRITCVLCVALSLIVASAVNAKQEESMKLTSPAFDEGATIPTKYTCDGEDISPALQWRDPPEGTKSLALIADDPDAPMGTWVHWVIYNIPADARELPEHIPADELLANGATQGITDFNRVGYGGPCPPPGPVHRYYFKLYALDQALSLPPKASKAQLDGEIVGHLLGQAQLMGRYQR